jgi:prevent-host-death family protein
MTRPQRVGVRELRQNLSVYLRLVKEGKILEVTERGKPVARLVPPSTGDVWFDAMIAAGKIRPATGDLSDLPPPEKVRPGEKPLSEILQEMRDAERF